MPCMIASRIRRRGPRYALLSPLLLLLMIALRLPVSSRTSAFSAVPGPAHGGNMPGPTGVISPTCYLPMLAGPPPPLPQITLNTYGWKQALEPSAPSDLFYPYPRLKFERLGPAGPVNYPLVTLENAYVKIAVMPEMGGRILRWQDKVTGRLLTYANPVIKPSHWGYRGWWFATGGIEWAFPVNEHGLDEYRPWQYATLTGEGWREVRVWDQEDRTGMTVEVRLRLYDDRSDLVIIPLIRNDTGREQRFQFWINAMLTLSDANVPSRSSLRFWVPGDQVIVHSTGIKQLEDRVGQPISWPYYGGLDYSRYADWADYLGFFAGQAIGAAGVYDEASDQGVIRVYPPEVTHGVKLFCLGKIGAYEYTDDNSAYFEFWGGLNRTFWSWDDATLGSGESISWEERWYPVHGITGLNWANGDLAALLRVSAEGVTVAAAASHPVQAHLVLRQNQVTAAEWHTLVAPDAPFRVVQALGDGGTAGWDLQIWQDGTLVSTVAP